MSLINQLCQALEVAQTHDPNAAVVLSELVPPPSGTPKLDITSYDAKDPIPFMHVAAQAVVGNLLLRCKEEKEEEVMILPSQGLAALAVLRELSPDPRMLPYFLLAVHVTKTKFTKALMMLTRWNTMSILEVGNIEGCELSELGSWCSHVAQHPKVLESIGELLQVVKVGLVGTSEDHATIDTFTINVQFVSCADMSLWGFAGIDTVYINDTMFRHKVEEAKISGPGCDLLVKKLYIQLAAITIHEFAHALQCKICKDFNWHYPQSTIPEVGFMLEERVFSFAANWLSTFNYLESEFDSIFEALKSGCTLPTFGKTPDVVREKGTCFGFYYQSSSRRF